MNIYISETKSASVSKFADNIINYCADILELRYAPSPPHKSNCKRYFKVRTRFLVISWYTTVWQPQLESACTKVLTLDMSISKGSPKPPVPNSVQGLAHSTKESGELITPQST